MIVDMAVYHDGRRAAEPPLDGLHEHCSEPGAFAWIGLHEPSGEEFDAVQREFGLHELAVEDAMEAHQRPKLEVYGDTLFVVVKTVYAGGDDDEIVDTGEVMLFVNPRYVISVRHGGSVGALGSVRRRLETTPALLRHGPGAVLYAVLDRVVDDYGPVIEHVEGSVQEVEALVFADGRQNPAGAIYHLEREVLEFHRAVAPLTVALERLIRGPFDVVPGELRTYLVDVQDHLLRVTQRAAGFRDLLTSLLHANLAQVSVRQNEDMRRISAWVAILAVPTMLAGIYGMNFEHMPELEWRFGYPLALAVMAAICSVLWVRFRRAGWL